MKYTMKHKVAAATISAALLLGTAAVLPAPSAYAAQSAEVIWGVNLRTAPTTASTVIRMLKKGENVSIVQDTGSGWYKISDKNGRTGYISSSSKYTTATALSGSDSTASGSSDNSSEAVPALNATVKKSVSFREGPTTSAKRIRYLKTNEQIQVVGKYNSSWYEVVDSNGVKGYVTTISKYLSVGTTSGSTGSGSGSAGSGSNTGSTGSGSATAPSSSTIEKVISSGMKYLGTPYEFGSNRSSTKTFDCSDFTRRVFIEGAGITLPADSRQQGAYVKKKGNVTTNINNLKRGDLMFFMSYKGSSASAYSGVNKSTARITHVGIYLGDGKILHTYSNASGGVRTNTIKGTHWEHRFLFGGSAL